MKRISLFQLALSFKTSAHAFVHHAGDTLPSGFETELNGLLTALNNMIERGAFDGHECELGTLDDLAEHLGCNSDNARRRAAGQRGEPIHPVIAIEEKLYDLDQVEHRRQARSA